MHILRDITTVTLQCADSIVTVVGVHCATVHQGGKNYYSNASQCYLCHVVCRPDVRYSEIPNKRYITHYCKEISLVYAHFWNDHFRKALAILGKAMKPLASSSYWKIINDKKLQGGQYIFGLRSKFDIAFKNTNLKLECKMQEQVMDRLIFLALKRQKKKTVTFFIENSMTKLVFFQLVKRLYFELQDVFKKCR